MSKVYLPDLSSFIKIPCGPLNFSTTLSTGPVAKRFGATSKASSTIINSMPSDFAAFKNSFASA